MLFRSKVIEDAVKLGADSINISKTVSKYLKDEDFTINWDETINSQIEINPFKWDKLYDGDKEFEIEGAYDVFTANQVLK